MHKSRSLPNLDRLGGLHPSRKNRISHDELNNGPISHSVSSPDLRDDFGGNGPISHSVSSPNLLNDQEVSLERELKDKERPSSANGVPDSESESVL